MVYGPISLLTLCDWATQGRVVAGNDISTDGENWFAAEELPDLKMDWVVELKNGKKFGPFNLLAAPFLLQRGIIEPDAILINPETKKQVAIKSLIEENSTLKSELSAGTKPGKGLVSSATHAASKETKATPPAKAPAEDAKVPPKTAPQETPAPSAESDMSKLVADLSQQAQERGAELETLKRELKHKQSEFDEAMHKAREKERSLLKRIAELEKGSRKSPEALDELRRQLTIEREKHAQARSQFEVKEAELSRIIEGLTEDKAQTEKGAAEFKAEIERQKQRGEELARKSRESDKEHQQQLQELQKSLAEAPKETNALREELKREKQRTAESEETRSTTEEALAALQDAGAGKQAA
jgi:DNA repair exonuclease SbcCD ATPase subunit